MENLQTWKQEARQVQNLIKIKRKRDSVFPASLSEVFSGFGGLSMTRLYLEYYNKLPFTIQLDGIKVEDAYPYFFAKYFTFIEDHFSRLEIDFASLKKNIPKADYFYSFLYDDLLINFEYAQDSITLLYKETDFSLIEALIEDLSRFLIQEEADTPHIRLLTQTHMGIELKKMELIQPKLDIASNYNDDFLEVHTIIHGRLKEKDSKGLVLLHGKPGSGKTSYLRFLSGELDKKIIFLPPAMGSSLDDPDFMQILLRNTNSILVIEDAEKIIVERENGNSPVSSLLNLTDGLLSDCLHIQVICSFNVGLSQIDKALLRKGRLIARYEFNELETEKAQKLSDALGFSNRIQKPTLLTDIYNQDEKDLMTKNRAAPIGFNLSKIAYKSKMGEGPF